MENGVNKDFFHWMKQEDVKEDEPMKDHTSFRVGGPAKLFLSIRSEEILSNVLKVIRENEIPYFVLGNGSNLLVSDQGYGGIVLYLDREFSEIKIKENEICTGAAALLSKVSKTAMEAGLGGLEFAAGIPGTIGGGTVMNAGAYGGELSQLITKVKVMDLNGNILILNRDELEFGYRKSIFKKRAEYIILEVTMELTFQKKEDILSKMKEFTKARQEKQPLEYPSAGSTFKRPENHFAGKLIMDAGLRGYQIGGARVSDKHCGFVINVGDAKAADITAIMKKIQETVLEKFDVKLEPEVIYLGE